VQAILSEASQITWKKINYYETAYTKNYKQAARVGIANSRVSNIQSISASAAIK
jgi:hypothetical protein